MSDALPRMRAAMEQSITDGLNPGVQYAVYQHGKLVEEGALGEARAGEPMTAEHLITWWSMTKPTAAVATMQLWERGLIDIEDPVVRYVPEFGVHGKERITIRHLLTHTGGFRTADRARGESWDDVIAAICEVRPEPGWEPGRTAGYHLTAGMTMLGEIVRRVDGRPFEEYVREAVFLPLGMEDCWVGMPGDVREQLGNRVGTMHNTEGDMPVPLDALDTPEAMAQCSPGGGGRGPMNQLVRLYLMLLGGGELDGVRVMTAQTVAAMTGRHRVGMFDKTFSGVVDWGLGVQVDAYNMGRHCSPRTFGHGGARSSISLADPEFGIAASIQANGMPEVGRHQARFHAITSALYDDLDCHWAGPEGREKTPARYA